jgi:NADPH:quinone reductase-like Zn-dependent oxidoreductase
MKDKELTMTVTPSMTGKAVLITGGTGGIGRAAIGLASMGARLGITDRYFANRKAKNSHKSSYDTATTARLWQVSADLVGLPVDARH